MSQSGPLFEDAVCASLSVLVCISRLSNYEDTVWRHEIIERATCVHLMCESLLSLMHFQHDGSEGLMKNKLLILRKRLINHIAVTCRFPEQSVCGCSREHERCDRLWT